VSIQLAAVSRRLDGRCSSEARGIGEIAIQTPNDHAIDEARRFRSHPRLEGDTLDGEQDVLRLHLGALEIVDDRAHAVANGRKSIAVGDEGGGRKVRQRIAQDVSRRSLGRISSLLSGLSICSMPLTSALRIRASSVAWNVRTAAATALVGVACSTSSPVSGTADKPHPGAESAGSDASYEGVDARGIPRYATIAIPSADSAALRQAYGIENPHRLYVSDSTEEGRLKYDTQRKRCLFCYVNSYRVGYVSVRRPDESWEEAERRVRATPPVVFTGGPNPASTSTADLDPDVRPLAEEMLRAARAAGFHLRVTATYRSPVREAFLMAEGKGRTHTLTSNHSYGRALDIVVDDGNRAHPRTKRDWIAFRRWVTEHRTPTGESFRVLGRVEYTWDWPHVELPSSAIGFETIADAVKRAHACLAPDSTVPCNFPPHLPAHLGSSFAR
jgi:hypothetical protein